MKRVIIVLLVCFILASVSVAAVPQVGHQFYGYAVGGNTVTVEAGGASFSTSIDSSGNYGYDPVFFVGAESDDFDGGTTGDDVTFFVDGHELGTYTFEVGGVTALDFDDAFGWNGPPATDGGDDDNGGGEWIRGDGSGGSSSPYRIPCHHDWICDDWGACDVDGFQTRICQYNGTCSVEASKPDTRQTCTYVAPPPPPAPSASCFDGVRNQGELGVDCGGPCPACEQPAPIVEEPGTNWMYPILGLLLLLLILIVIFAKLYKDGKLQKWWNQFLVKIGKKPKTPPRTATATRPQVQRRPTVQRKQTVQQQYRQYNQQYRPRQPVRRPVYRRSR